MVLQQHLSEKLQEKQPLIVLVVSVDKVSDACKNTNSKFINQFFGKKKQVNGGLDTRKTAAYFLKEMVCENETKNIIMTFTLLKLLI